METEEVIERVYWSIGDVASELGVKPFTIRFWLDEFGISIAKRSANNGKEKESTIPEWRLRAL